HSAQDQPAIEGAEHRARGVLDELQALGERAVIQNHGAAHAVGVPVQVLGGAVDDDVHPERERALEVRAHERVVHHDRDSALMGRRRALIDGEDNRSRRTVVLPADANSVCSDSQDATLKSSDERWLTSDATRYSRSTRFSQKGSLKVK